MDFQNYYFYHYYYYYDYNNNNNNNNIVCVLFLALGPSPVHMFCPTCHNYIITETDKSPSNEAYLCCMLIFIVGYVHNSILKYNMI